MRGRSREEAVIPISRALSRDRDRDRREEADRDRGEEPSVMIRSSRARLLRSVAATTKRRGSHRQRQAASTVARPRIDIQRLKLKYPSAEKC